MVRIPWQRRTLRFYRFKSSAPLLPAVSLPHLRREVSIEKADFIASLDSIYLLTTLLRYYIITLLMLYIINSKNEHKNGVGGMVLYKRSGRFCPRTSTLTRGLIQEIRGRWRWEAPSDCAVAQ